MSESDRWREQEPPASGPSVPPSLRFNPLSTGIGVFVAVAIPIIVVGFSRAGSSLEIAIIAVLIGLIAGLIAGVWVDARDGRVWRGPQL